MHSFRLIDDARVIIVHSVNIGPDDYFISHESSTDKRSGVIRTSTLEIVHLSVGITTDETLGNIDLITFIGTHYLREMLLDIMCVRLSILVSTHEVEGINKQSLYANLLEIIDHHIGADYLALSNDNSLFETCEYIFGETTKITELVSKKLASGLLHFLSGIELINVLHIFLFEGVDDLISSVRVFLVEVIAHLNERVCRSRHSREHYECRFSRLCYELRDILHTLW